MTPYIIVGTVNLDIKRAIKAIVKNLEVAEKDIFEILPEKKEITIGQIRELKKETIYESSIPRLYIIRQFDTAGLPAQNASLKLLEEHPANIQFILIASNEHAVIPTIRSRAKIIRIKNTKEIVKELSAERVLDTLVKKGDMEAFMSETFATAKLESIDYIIDFFRIRARDDAHATNVLREALRIRALVTGNNVSPQVATDHLLIYVRQAYSAKSS